MVLVVSNDTITTDEEYEACGSLTAGPSFVVGNGGSATFITGGDMVFGNGFEVLAGGEVRTVFIEGL